MIPNYWWRTHKVLPTVYDESLSYYEVLNKITYYINQIIKSIEEFEETTTEQVTNISELVTNIRNDVDELNTRCSALETLTSQHTTKINTNTSDISSLKTRTTALENKTTTHDGEISTLGQQISDIDNRVDNLETEYIFICSANIPSDQVPGGSTDYVRFTLLQNNVQSWLYNFGSAPGRYKPNASMIKKENNIVLRISATTGESGNLQFVRPVRINVDGSEFTTVTELLSSQNYIQNVTIPESAFNTSIKIHNISIEM